VTDQLTDAILDSLFVGIIKGGPGSGYHEHPGRPGHVGGSLPSGSPRERLLTKPIPMGFSDEGIMEFNEEAARLDLEQFQRQALMNGANDFARSVEKIAGHPMDWTLGARAEGGGLRKHILAFDITGTDSAGERATMQLRLKPENRVLELAYTRASTGLRQHGLATSILETAKRTALNAGMDSVHLLAVSNQTNLAGAYVWAKQGVKFADDYERNRVMERYMRFLHNEGHGKTTLDHRTANPIDIANDVIDGKQTGRDFLVNTNIDYEVHIPVR